MLELSKELPKNYLESGLNLLYFGDKHYQFKKPSNRIDDFSETEKNKVTQVLNIAKENNVRAIIQPGDFLDKPRLPDSFVEAILDEWGFSEMNNARERYEGGEITKEEMAEAILGYIPIIGTVGNHELYGGSLKTLPRTTLGFMSSIGFVNLVDKNNPYILTTKGGRSVAISGLPYDLNLLKDKNNFVLDKKFGDTDIFLVHEALYNTTLGPEVNWLPIDTIYKDTKADVTIAGHIHHGFGWLEKDGKIFGNPGALAQQSSAKTELDRDLFVSLIHISEDGDIFVKDIKLDSLRSRELFDLSQKDEKVRLEKQATEVKHIIDKIKPIANNGLATSIISEVAKIEDVPKDITEIAIEKTREAEENIRQTEPLKDDVDYRVTKIELKNFEAHANTTIDIKDDNVPYVFIGESSNGKTSIARALYFFFENEGNALSFVRKHPSVTECEVTLHRADGLVATRFVTVKKTRKTSNRKISEQGWRIVYPNGEETVTNTQGLELIQSLFGFTYLYLDDKDKININFRKQKDGDFFLNLKPQQRAKVIGALFGMQYILAAIKSLDSLQRSKKSESRVITSDIATIDNNLLPLSLVEQEEFVVDTLSGRFDNLSNKIEKVTLLDSINGKLVDIVRESSKLDELLDKKDNLDFIEESLSNLDKMYRELSQLRNLGNQLFLDDKELSLINPVVEKAEIVSVTDGLLGELEKKISISNKTVELNSLLKNSILELNTINSLLDSKDDIKEIQSDFDKLSDLANRFSRLKLLNENLSSLELELVSIDELLEQFSNSSDSLDENILTLGVKIDTVKKVKELVEVLTNNTSEIEKINDVLESKNKEKDDLTKKISELEASYATINIGGLVLHGVKRIGAEMNETEFKDLKKRLDVVKEVIIRSETRRESLVSSKEQTVQQIEELGFDPENLPEEIQNLNNEIENLYNNIDNNLKDVESVAKKLKGDN